jgi:hypothetical protein
VVAFGAVAYMVLSSKTFRAIWKISEPAPSSSFRAGVNQQPPVHYFRMRPFKPFWGWTQNTLNPCTGIFESPSLPQNCPLLTFPPPTSLTSFPAHFISKGSENSWAWDFSLTSSPKLRKTPKLE